MDMNANMFSYDVTPTKDFQHHVADARRLGEIARLTRLLRERRVVSMLVPRSLILETPF